MNINDEEFNEDWEGTPLVKRNGERCMQVNNGEGIEKDFKADKGNDSETEKWMQNKSLKLLGLENRVADENIVAENWPKDIGPKQYY